MAAARRPELGVAGRAPRDAAGDHRSRGRADRAAAAAVTRLLDGRGRGRGAATRVRGDVHARSRTGARHRPGRRTGRVDRRRPAPGRRRDGRARRRPGVAGVLDVPGELHRRVRVHHRRGRVPAQRDQPGHAGDGRRAAARHARRRRAGADRVRAVADLVGSARARLAGRAGRRPARIPVRCARRLHHRDPSAVGRDPPGLTPAAAGSGQRRVDRRAVAVGAAGAPDRSRARPGGAGDRAAADAGDACAPARGPGARAAAAESRGWPASPRRSTRGWRSSSTALRVGRAAARARTARPARRLRRVGRGRRCRRAGAGRRAG